MATLSRELRRELERTVIKARREAEIGAKKALEQLAVHNHEPWSGMTADQRSLRNRLRAHGRQLGDLRDVKSEKQTIDHLVTECAYEHWHRMLFARFLAECGLLIEPESGVPISLSECQELARERGTDWLTLASSFAVRMLPQIFRAGDPALEVSLPPETRQVLEELLKLLAREVFVADDSLGWVYQFWQTEQKNQVNDSEVKIGADELAAVTQLFTEDYMVLFLLHNTLGAWWAAKRKAEGKEWRIAGYEWTYLRFKEDGSPAAGNFEGWPRAARDLKVLDPCEGSGHFLVFALPILAAFRMEEEALTKEQAVYSVLRDNLFGLELDLRCTQIAAFNLALTAWRMVGYYNLPQLNIACSGLGINAKEEDWIKLAGKDEQLRGAMKRLYDLFQRAPTLGSLIDPKRVGGDLFAAEFARVRPLLEKALAAELKDESGGELAVAAQGLLKAAGVMTEHFVLVVTNVPYLSRSRQDDFLREYADTHFARAKNDLATCFLERCFDFCVASGSVGLVLPTNWMALSRYQKLREHVLGSTTLHALARLGPGAFETISGEVVNVALFVASRAMSQNDHFFVGIDVLEASDPSAKAEALRSTEIVMLRQSDQLTNPDARLLLERRGSTAPLSRYADSRYGLRTGDLERLALCIWELPAINANWKFLQGTVRSTCDYGGRERVLLWEDGQGELRKLADAGIASIQGAEAWGKSGIAVSLMSDLPVSLYTGEIFDNGTGVVWANQEDDLAAIFCFCESTEFNAQVRKLDNSIKVTNQTLLKVPFDLTHWQTIATEKYPAGLPVPNSVDPTQWLFAGNPKDARQPLQVAVARLLGYRWPRQTGSSFPNCSTVGPDGLEGHGDVDGIVSLNSAKGEQPAAARLRSLLADAYGKEWSATKQAELLVQAGYGGKSLEEWLRDGFFEQHCDLFHQRPFIWHIWDGLRYGFHVLVNYHKLVEPNGAGRRTLEKLIYTYLGDWIERQRADQKMGVEGADARVAAAVHLKAQLEKILEGEAPYDIFARWKPLHEQAIGWEPTINDGVRINIRPFVTAKTLDGRTKNSCILRYVPKIKWDKDRGKEPHREVPEFPWFWGWDGTSDFGGGKEFDGNRWNDLHYTRKHKQTSRGQYAQNQSKPGSRP